jgi:hypothetical protein
MSEKAVFTQCLLYIFSKPLTEEVAVKFHIFGFLDSDNGDARHVSRHTVPPVFRRDVLDGRAVHTNQSTFLTSVTKKITHNRSKQSLTKALNRKLCFGTRSCADDEGRGESKLITIKYLPLDK